MIIGLVGYKGCGKTTACSIIKKNLPDVVQVNFKDSLIEEIEERFPDLLVAIVELENDIRSLTLAKELCFGDLFTAKPPLIRTLMQNYGTNVRRADDPDYWVKEWVESIREHRDKTILTDDVRFLNEAGTIQGYNGILIRLERPDLNPTDTHLSETEQKKIECDYTITCVAGELDKLEHELVKIIIREQA